MQEQALLGNMATILCKDLVMDVQKNEVLETTQRYAQLLADDDVNIDNDDEDEQFFLRQQRKRSNSTAAATAPAVKAAMKIETVSIIKQEPDAVAIIKQEPKTTRNKEARNSDEDDVLPPFKLIKLERQPTQLKPHSLVPLHRPPLPRLNLLIMFPEWQFENYLHMRKSTYVHNFQWMYNALIRAVQNVTPTTVHALGVWKLSTDEHFEEIARRFKLPIIECQHHVRRFWDIISDNYERFIKWPGTECDQMAAMKGFETHRHLKVFPKLFGIVAIKRLDVYLSSENTEVPLIMQIVCNGHQKIMDVFVDHTEDYSFDSTPIGQTMAYNPQTLPSDCYLIGNETFPLKPYLMRAVGDDSNDKNAAFNKLLEPAYEFADTVLDKLAKRFNVLYAMEARNIGEVRKIVETICALHNLCIHNDDDFLEENPNVIEFNWARSNDENNEHDDLPGSESDEEGLEIRCKLVDTVMRKN